MQMKFEDFENDDVRMYCNNCHGEFRDADAGKWSMTHWELGADNGNIVEDKSIEVCPFCGSNDIEGLYLCEVCNENYAHHNENLCDKCDAMVEAIPEILERELGVSKYIVDGLIAEYTERYIV